MPWGVAAAAVGAAGSLGGGLLQSGATKAAQEDATWMQAMGNEIARETVGEWTHAGQEGIVKAADYAGINGGPRALAADDAARFRTGAIYGQNALLPPTTNVAGQLAGIYGPEQAQAAMANFQTSPGYQWRFNEGLRAVDAGAASRGMLRSGAQLKAEQAYGQGLASQEYGTYFDRASAEFGNQFNRQRGAFEDYYNRLYNIASLGANAANHVAANTVATGAGIAQTIASAGNQQANIIGQTTQGIANAFNNYANNSAYQDRTNALLGASGPAYPAPYTSIGNFPSSPVYGALGGQGLY